MGPGIAGQRKGVAMKVAIASGKGGAGKTMVRASLDVAGIRRSLRWASMSRNPTSTCS